jgi:hypothetical protein
MRHPDSPLDGAYFFAHGTGPVATQFETLGQARYFAECVNFPESGDSHSAVAALIA